MIISTVPDDDYSYKSGTSMSAPYVSGLAGLLFSCQGATASSVRRAIESGSRPVGEWVQKGRIDVRASLEQIGCRGKIDEGDKSGGGDQGRSRGGEKSSSGPVEEIFAPSGYELISGKTLSSPSNSLVKSDDRRLVLESKGVGLKRVLDFYVTASLRSGAAIASLEVKVEASSQHPGEASLYGFNWSTNKWDWLGKVKLRDSDAVASYTVKNHEAYVSPKGEVRVKLYREEKRWTKFGMSTDWVSFVTVRRTAESGAGSKSLGERVKEKWKKWTR
jgi:subtilisin family serine protease